MGTMMVVLALAALALSEIVFSRIERSRKLSDALEDPAAVEPDIEFDDEVEQQPVTPRAGDYSELTPAELRQRAKARLGPRAW